MQPSRMIFNVLAIAFAAAAAFASPAGAAQIQATTLLGQLVVATGAQSGYDRGLFHHWIDANGDGCDTRDEVLIGEAVVRPTVGLGCRLTGGRWRSAYDAIVVTNASALDIDHFVPLAEAWRSGASDWSADTREAFANDLGYPLSLIAVTAGSNRSKSDQDPATWLPTLNSFRCTYVATWVAVKWRWRLTIDAVEQAALRVLIAGCGSRALVQVPPRATIVAGPPPAPGGAAAGGAGAGGGASAGGAAGGLPATPGTGGNDPRFATCSLAIRGGYGPYVRGVDPEYAWYRDGDKDGTVCEH